MSVKSLLVIGLATASLALASTGPVRAGCVTKAAQATAGTEASAKWFAMETIVQQISWGLWPGWVASGKIAGHSVRNRKARCSSSGLGSTCKVQATICTTG